MSCRDTSSRERGSRGVYLSTPWNTPTVSPSVVISTVDPTAASWILGCPKKIAFAGTTSCTPANFVSAAELYSQSYGRASSTFTRWARRRLPPSGIFPPRESVVTSENEPSSERRIGFPAGVKMGRGLIPSVKPRNLPPVS